MKPTTLTCTGFASLMALIALAPVGQAHTWLENIMRIAPNGSLVGAPGYPRGYVPRTLTFSDPDMEWQLPRTGNGRTNAFSTADMMCKPTQTIGNQSVGYPALVASAGERIALRYLENGHVTKPQTPVGKPAGSGIVYVYGTENPLATDTYVGIHGVWNPAGTGGDQRGRLLATRYFDDGECYQHSLNNSSAISLARQTEFPQPGSLTDLQCQSDVQIPIDATGNYTMYWVWDWPILDVTTGAVLSNESYTTCMDIVLTPSTGGVKPEAISFQSGQVYGTVAIAAQLSNQFMVDPVGYAQKTFVPDSAPATFTGSVATAIGSVAQAPTSISKVGSTPSSGVQLSTTASRQTSTTAFTTMGMVTVTVTADLVDATTTVTKIATAKASIQTAPASSASPMASIQTAPPSPSSSATSTTARPVVIPFLDPTGQTTAPMGVSTQSPPSASTPTAMASSQFKLRGRQFQYR